MERWIITNLAETRKGKVFQKPRMAQETEIPSIMKAASWPHNTIKSKSQGHEWRIGEETQHA